jgi:hypothetical protein
MSTPIDEALLKQKQQIIEAMVSYMKYGGAEDEADEDYDPDFDAGYTQENIDQCDSILLDFLANVQAHSGAQASVIMNDVKTLVLALNALNEKCDYTIIETDQREDICALIGDAANKAGVTLESDATDEWREW